MAGWVLWALATCALAIGEALIAGLLLAPLAVGAAAAAITELAGAGGLASWIVFVAVSLLLLAVARFRVGGTSQLRDGAEALIGRQAVVLERIANREGVGCVRIDGEVWTARALDGNHVIDRGTRVEVVEVKGATALVTE